MTEFVLPDPKEMAAKAEDPSHEIKVTKEPEEEKQPETKETPPTESPGAYIKTEPEVGIPEQAPTPQAFAAKEESSGDRPSRSALPAGISLKIFQNDADDQPDEPELEEMPGEIPADDIPAELFLSVWKKLAESRKEDSHGLFLAMTKYDPVLNKNGVIQVFLDNSIQQDLIAERRLEMLSYLRKELSNYALQIETRIRENGLIQKAYLPKDKLERFIEKNPDIAELRNKLDLEFDY